MLPRFATVLIVVAAVVVLVGFALIRLSDEETDGGTRATGRRTFASNDPMKRGCDLPIKYLERIWKGHDPVHSEDVTTVPLEPNSSGTFSVTSHSGPWDYLQNVPLVFYGPGFIKGSGEPLEGPAETVDVFSTVGELVGVDLPHRDGRALEEILEQGRQDPPKLILTIVWDGVGRNVLERWPDAWPNLARLEREGTSLVDAVVGSSPSITPATHSNLGTGAYPRRHGVTAIEYRTEGGSVRQAFAKRNPADLRLTTMADEIDLAMNNEPKVGMLAWKGWHLGMLGHGTQTPGGDADEVGLIGTDEHITGNNSFYSTPAYINPLPGLEGRLDEADRLDGRVDGNWRGHTVSVHDNPGWVDYAADAVLTMLDRGGYGADEVPDLFFTNFKMTDIAGHQYSMDSIEERDVLHAAGRGAWPHRRLPRTRCRRLRRSHYRGPRTHAIRGAFRSLADLSGHRSGRHRRTLWRYRGQPDDIENGRRNVLQPDRHAAGRCQRERRRSLPQRVHHRRELERR